MASRHRSAKRGHAIWWFRGGALAFALAYLLLPYSLTAYVPIWLPFLCVLAVEAQFFLGGLRSSPRPHRAAGLRGGPQQRDIVALSDWFELDLAQRASLHVGAGELTAAEVADWVAVHADDLAELAPGDYEVGPLSPGLRRVVFSRSRVVRGSGGRAFRRCRARPGRGGAFVGWD